MSFSPVRVTPLSSTRADPRAASRLPVPVDRTKVCTASGAGAWLAAYTSTRPLPWACELAAGSERAVLVSSALTWSG